MDRTTKIKITELNPHVICTLCGGYFVNATTITECLHSFCRTCIMHYLKTRKYCPVCDVMVHKTRPLDCIRSDKTLQDMVYKLIPDLYKSEMKRRREYYAKIGQNGVSQPPSEDRGDEFHDRIIYTEDEKISLSLELCADGIPFKTPTNVHDHNGPETIKIKDVRYLQCPAAVSVGNLKKFIRMKFDLKLKYEMDIFHTTEPLPDYYTLMDIAYIYTWTRRKPLRLFYTVFERKLTPKAPDPVSCQASNNIPKQIFEQKDKRKHVLKGTLKTVRHRARNKKKNRPGGPDDISPDLDLEKSEARNQKRIKIGALRTRVKKLVADDDLVLEAMSESEKQLAKLTLNSSADARMLTGIDIETTNNANAVFCEIDNFDKQKNFTNIADNIKGQYKNVATVGNMTGIDTAILDTNTNENECSTPSPGSGLVRLSLLQPLNATCDEHSEIKAKGESLYEFVDSDAKIKKVKELSENQNSRWKSKKRVINDTINEDRVPSKKVRENGTNVVLSKSHSVLNSLTVKKGGKKVDNKRNAMQNKSTRNNAGVESKTMKNISKEGKYVKRKYARKVKANIAQAGDKKVKLLDSETNLNNTRECSFHDTNNSFDGKLNTESNANELKDLDNKDVTDTEKRVDIVQKLDNDTPLPNLNDPERSQPNSLQQPSTPLYGQIPKVDESNLPHSPKTNFIIISNKDTVVSEKKSCNVDGAKNIVVTSHNLCINTGAIDKDSNALKNGDYAASSYGNTMRPVVSVYPNQVTHGFITLDAHHSNFDVFHNSLTSFPPNSLCVLSYGVCYPPPTTAHANQLTNGSHLDVNCDQPLDLRSSNGQRQEYTKGKIFKTKLVKKSFPKHVMQPSEEKTSIPSSNDVKSSDC